MTPDSRGIVRFGGFALDPGTGELWRDGEPVDLPPQPARLLALLARSPGRIVSRDRIREEVWSDTVVEFDQAINNAVRQVRDALGDDASDPRFIETVPRRGYRFVAPLEPVVADDEPGHRPAGEATPDDAEPLGASATRGRTRRWSPARFGAFTAIAIGIAAAVWIGVGGGSDPRTTVAVVPARASTAGSPAEALADSLTDALIAQLGALDTRRLRVIPWTLDMSLAPEAGQVTRGDEVLDIDLVVDVNVYADEPGFAVSVALTTLPGRNQVWYRRFEALPSDHAAATTTVTEGVAAAVRENLLRTGR